MITRLPSATTLPLAYDVCPLGADNPSLSIDILLQGFLALDNHAQLTVGREIKRHLRERLIDDLNAQPIDTAALAVGASETASAAIPRRARQVRRTGG